MHLRIAMNTDLLFVDEPKLDIIHTYRLSVHRIGENMNAFS